MKKNDVVTILTMSAVILLVFMLFAGCSKVGKNAKTNTFMKLLNSYSDKEVAISMWNPERSKAVVSSYTIAEVNSDYIIVQEKSGVEIMEAGTIQKKIAIPFSNIVSLVLSDVPPTVVLNDQILLTGFGDSIDGLGYVGSRLDRIRQRTE